MTALSLLLAGSLLMAQGSEVASGAAMDASGQASSDAALEKAEESADAVPDGKQGGITASGDADGEGKGNLSGEEGAGQAEDLGDGSEEEGSSQGDGSEEEGGSQGDGSDGEGSSQGDGAGEDGKGTEEDGTAQPGKDPEDGQEDGKEEESSGVQVSFLDSAQPSNGKYYSGKRTALFQSFDKDFSAGQAKAYINGTEIPLENLKWSRGADGLWAAEYPFLEDGSYTFSMTSSQNGGTTNPIVSEFVIDTKEPEASFTGISNGSSKNGDVSLEASVEDANLDISGASASLTGPGGRKVALQRKEDRQGGSVRFILPSIPHSKSFDGYYSLSVKGKDLAGNTVEKEVWFIVNRFGSVFSLEDADGVLGKYINFTPSLTIREKNADALVDSGTMLVVLRNGVPKILKKGQDYQMESSGSGKEGMEYGYKLEKSIFQEEGSYSIQVYSLDASGNRNYSSKEMEIRFGIDRTPPEIQPLNLEEGGTYNASVLRTRRQKPAASSTGGKDVASAWTEEKDAASAWRGKKDAAAGASCYEAAFSIRDNLSVVKANAYLDGQEVSLEKRGKAYYVSLPAKKEGQKLRITAEDAAGNVGEYTISPVYIQETVGSTVTSAVAKAGDFIQKLLGKEGALPAGSSGVQTAGSEQAAGRDGSRNIQGKPASSASVQEDRKGEKQGGAGKGMGLILLLAGAGAFAGEFVKKLKKEGGRLHQ